MAVVLAGRSRGIRRDRLDGRVLRRVDWRWVAGDDLALGVARIRRDRSAA